MERDTEQTVVHFRKWRNGEIIAIFPQQESHRPFLCGSYEHIGQHGDCSPVGITQSLTNPAKPAEYDALARELSGLGYNLEIKAKLHASDYWWNRKQHETATASYN